MKPCRDIKTIERLIRHHIAMKMFYENEARNEDERIETLKDYIRELKKPGFKHRHYIKAGTSNHGNAVITASNTFEDV